MVLRTEEFNLTAPKNAANHRFESYYRKFKEVADAREINTYTNPKSLVVDHRFWDGFHSNFYASVIFDCKKSKICKMHYIDWAAMRDKNEPEFNAAIDTCEKYELTNIMGFRYNWNVEILAQFHSTYFWNRDSDEIHWMTDGRHYRVSFITFCQILGFGQMHRTYSRIHQDNPFRVSDISHCWRDPSQADGKRSGLKSYYYVMNNLLRNTIDPKDGAASDICGFVRNLLARFPDGEKFNVGRFIWVQLAYAMDDARRSLPYAPYLMFMIERVSGYIFPKDGFHTVYNIEKTQSYAAATETVGGTSRGREDIPESSHSRSRSRSSGRGLSSTVKAWMRAIFGHCSYASQTAYDTRMELRESLQRTRERAGLAPFPPAPVPPQFELPDLSGTEQSSDSGQHSSDDDE
jgi:hypothetical protein